MLNTLGLAEHEIQSRENVIEKHFEGIKELAAKVVDEIKEADGWKKISFTSLQKKNKILPSQRSTLIYALQQNENIINRIMGGLPDVPASSTLPLEYKYVDKEEKENLKVNGIYLRNIQGETKENLDKFFKDKTLKNKLVDILIVIDYLISRGAKDGWIKLDVLRAISLIGMKLSTMFNVFEELQELGLLVAAKKEIKQKVSYVYVLTKDEEDYQNRKKEAENPDEITVYEPPIKKRNRKKKAPIAEAVKQVEEMPSQVPMLTGDIPRAFHQTSTALLQYLKETEEKAEKQGDIIEGLVRENEGLKSRNDAQSKLVSKYKKQADSLSNFNDGYITNAQAVMTIMSGRFMSLIDEFTRLHNYQLRDTVVVDKYRGRVIEILSDTVSQIMNYKREETPPEIR